MFAICAVGSAVPLILADDIMAFAAALFGLLFFGGALVPSLVGILLNSVPVEMRTSANSLAQISANLLGFLPAPSFYGQIAFFVADETSKIPFAGLISTLVFTVSFVLIGICAKVSKEDKLRE